ncbi:hypothetical protein METESE_08110 [Mesoterricola sediminis]|uniref:Uncharacterized protein n=2 Tax=Mesoterricola sediminis TaxID=2927980 RepID=A0AA48H4J5_9BACT|nr:hypothetical protein METESE_08110 [Mesoterricola sediminis]
MKGEMGISYRFPRMPMRIAPLLLLLCVLACRSPLAQLPRDPAGPRLDLAPVRVEDHSRQLKRLRPLAPGEANTPETRASALAAHGHWLEGAFREDARARGIRVEAGAPLRLELTVTDLGEVRTSYIILGIASGVAWGVGTGLVAHDTRLAVGLGGYELLEESAFWILGSSVFGAWSAPAVVEAKVYREGEAKPVWADTFYALSGRALTKGLPPAARGDREIQLRAALQRLTDKILVELAQVPGFPGPDIHEPAAAVTARLLEGRPPAPVPGNVVPGSPSGGRL